MMKTFFTYLLFSALLLVCCVEKKLASEAKRRSLVEKPVPLQGEGSYMQETVAIGSRQMILPVSY